MPVYNEEKTIEKIVSIIESVKIDKEIIIVDDASCDRTGEILRGLKRPGIKVFSHKVNSGKGAAVRTGLKNSSGEIVIIQDADLEYDPRDYPNLIAPILSNQADFVLGIRFTKGYKGLIAHRLGNLFLTWLQNVLYGCRLSDTHTCYKVTRREVFNSFDLKSNDFSLEQEIISKALKRSLRIIEVPIAYHPRSYSQGKKIRYHDAFDVIIHMLRLRFGKG